ncbi:membrane-associated phospholipid phosphatase [Wenyingzhuangia heitensis]|uniref:Membrane-associated phospholipid phosphatase n=1 Tax=Wenyingzhuangia heitensis TaxID=1487859 RepID=A0ABX0U996_9FLAO|nr:phosphatase PAP2 family protein [Wenyingzhuangia heitensis]NIJ44510.1 membrane-associated phospholipid phosphatase [Wenyingzhuangia heitensis]
MKKLFIFFLICFAHTAYSQETIETEETTLNTIKSDVNSTLKGIGRFYTSPLRWKKKDYIGAGAVIGGFAALTLIDSYTEKMAKRHEPHIPSAIKKFGDGFGGHVNAFAFSGGIYATGLITKNNKIRKTGALMFTSVLAAGSLQTIIKVIAGRARPRVGNYNTLDPFTLDKQYHAFPSGHSIVSMVFVHSIARQIDNTWIKVGLYSAGAIVPISRVWAESHWLSDVALGTTLGILTVNYLDNYLTEIYEGKKEQKLTQFWKLRPGLGSLNLSYTFN